MKLYIANGSTNCRKVQAVANHLGITIETIYLDYMKGDPKSSAYLRINPTGRVPALADNDFKGKKQIGSDVLYCTGAGTKTTHCHVGFAQKGGLLYAKFALSDTGALKGAVTGGTGSFAKAKGTLTGQAESQTDVKITLHYKR